MPINRRDIGGGRLRNSGALPIPIGHVEQRQDSSEKVQAMCRGQDIKEAATWIGDQENTLTGKLAPGDELTGQKKDSQACGYAPPLLEGDLLVSTQMPARDLNGNAAGQKNQRVQPEDTRKIECDPIITQSLAHEKRAGQRHEKHDDAGKSKLNDCEVGALRYTGGAAGAFSLIVAASGNVCPPAATGVNYLDLVCDCTRHNRTPLVCLAHLLRRQVLRNVVVRRAWNAEFIRPAIDHRDVAGKIIERGRRGNTPFERGRVPWILGGLLPRLHTVEEVE